MRNPQIKQQKLHSHWILCCASHMTNRFTRNPHMKSMQKRRNKWVRDRRREREKNDEYKNTNKHRSAHANNNKPLLIYSFAWQCGSVWMLSIGQSSRNAANAHRAFSSSGPPSVCERRCVLYVYSSDHKITVWFHRCLNGSEIKSYDLIQFFRFLSLGVFQCVFCCWQSTWQSDNGIKSVRGDVVVCGRRCALTARKI